MPINKRKRGYTIRCYEQLIDWMSGNSRHNYIDDECCPDFTCCANLLPDNPRAKKIVFESFMEDNFAKIRDYKIKKILKG
jgi:hypothetical protein